MSTLKANKYQHVDRTSPSIEINSDGSVSISSTVTYEDVTSVDSVGLVTARSGIHVSSGIGVSIKSGGLNVTAGVTTVQALQATTGTFTGDVDIADKIVHTGDTNTTLRFPAADTITAETAGSERFRIDATGGVGINTTLPGGNGLGVAVDNSSTDIISTGSVALNLKNTNTTDNTWVSMDFYNSGGSIGGRFGAKFKDTSDKDTDLYFATRADGGSLTERVRIDSEGNMGLGVAPIAPGHTTLHINESASSQPVRLQMTTNGTGATASDGFTLSIDGSNSNVNLIQRESAGMLLYTAGTLRQNITSDGRVLIGGHSTASIVAPGGIEALTTAAGNIGGARFVAGSSGPNLTLAKSRNATVASHTIVQDDDTLGVIKFRGSDGGEWVDGATISSAVDGTPGDDDMPGRLVFATTADGASSASERMRITSAGDVCINRTSVLDDAKLSINCDATQPAIGIQCSHTNTDTKLISAWNSGAKNIVNITAETDNSPYLKFEIWNASASAVTERFRVTHLGNVAIGGGTAGSNRLEVIEDHSGFPADSAQPNATLLVKHGTSGTNRRWIGIGASLASAWIQSSSPGGSGLAAPISINPGGGTVSIGATGYHGGDSAPGLYISNSSGRQVKIHNTSDATTSLQLTNSGSGQGEDNGLQLALLSNDKAYINNAETATMYFGTAGSIRMSLRGNHPDLVVGADEGWEDYGTVQAPIMAYGTSGYPANCHAIKGVLANTSYTEDGGGMFFLGGRRTTTSGYTMAGWYTGNDSDAITSDRQFRFVADGNAYCDGSWSGGGADYAEFFEWSDGNSSDENRKGISVVLDNGKIRPATGSDNTDNIIGVISANPVIVGDSASERWKEKWITDDFGDPVYEEYTITEWYDETKKEKVNYATDRIPSDVTVGAGSSVLSTDKNGNAYTRKKLNPSWNSTATYIPRKDRKEWDIVGLMGKLKVKSDQRIGTKWIKIREVNSSVHEYLIR